MGWVPMLHEDMIHAGRLIRVARPMPARTGRLRSLLTHWRAAWRDEVVFWDECYRSGRYDIYGVLKTPGLTTYGGP